MQYLLKTHEHYMTNLLNNAITQVKRKTLNMKIKANSKQNNSMNNTKITISDFFPTLSLN